MEKLVKIKNALISVYHKNNLDEIILKLNSLGVKLFSTGGTLEYINKLGINAVSVESVTGYPSILGGRVKTLHPKIMGGILARRDDENDKNQVKQYDIPFIDLIIVDLYPFADTLKTSNNEDEIIEKIDIGGISLIRAAAKNFNDVMIVPSSNYYERFLEMLNENNGVFSIDDRKTYASYAFNVSSSYDSMIFNYFNQDKEKVFNHHINESEILRYGENPHQAGVFYGNLHDVFEQNHGKQISYNNLLDIDAALNLINEFEETTFAVLKHNNACGLACRTKLIDAWKDALAGDPVSAFGGVLVTNREIDIYTANEINKLFFEVILAPSYTKEAIEILESKKNRIILNTKNLNFPAKQFKTILNGVIEQDKDLKTDKVSDMQVVTKTTPTKSEYIDMEFANIIVKHTKSNAIVLAKNKQLISSGVGQTSRVDALKQAIIKASEFGFDLNGAVMASDAFFPFHDCVEIAHKAGITAVIQPGGSINDKLSIKYCDENNISMVVTGTRHFKH